MDDPLTTFAIVVVGALLVVAWAKGWLSFGASPREEEPPQLVCPECGRELGRDTVQIRGSLYHQRCYQRLQRQRERSR